MMLLSDSVDRLAAMLVDPNAYGGLLAVAFAIVLLADDRERPLMAGWLRVACLLSLSIGLFLTSSRSAWLGCALLSMFGIVRNPRLLLGLPIMVAVGVAAVAFSVGEDGFESMVTVSSRQNTIDERVEINENAFKMFVAASHLRRRDRLLLRRARIIVHNSVMWFLASSAWSVS